LGLVPPRVQTVRHLGNTSLAMARALALAPERLEAMSALADGLQKTHCMFAASRTFTTLFLLELAYWTEGMPMAKLRELLRRSRLPDLPPPRRAAHVVRTAHRDIGDLGRMGMVILERIGAVTAFSPLSPRGCAGCSACADSCPSRALSSDGDAASPTFTLEHERCDGTACLHCERACPSGVFRLRDLFDPGKRDESNGA
jgi:ferredoxin